MINILDSTPAARERSSLRPLDIFRDLNPVSNLIELCFSDTMDADGREYLRQMRKMAGDSRLVRWAVYMAEQASLPISGFVWEEDGRIVGNLSLIPFHEKNRKLYLVANVAVHPDYRRRGIARMLTESALKFAQERGSSSTWLQVRVENQAATRLYQSLGFRERARRVTWQIPAQHKTGMSRGRYPLTPRYPSDWEIQRTWLNQVYPPQVAWNLPLRPQTLGPGIINGLMRFLNDEVLRHWAVRVHGDLKGVLTWQPSRSFADNLWLAAADQTEEAVIDSLLSGTAKIRTNKALALNLPAGLFESSLIPAGFQRQHTLIWMENLPIRKIEVAQL